MSDFETKFISSNANAHKLKYLLDTKFEKDNEYPETYISSIYFDDVNMNYLYEKESSDHIKSKFRIRWYEDIKTQKPSDICFLEFKHKVGEDRFKKRIKLDNIYASMDLESPKLLNSVDQLRLFEGNILGHVYPSFIVRYKRHRYKIKNTGIRLCIDSNIHVLKNNKRLLKRSFKKGFLNQCVFELKGETARLPSSLNFIEQIGFFKDSFSKYEQCYRQLIE